MKTAANPKNEENKYKKLILKENGECISLGQLEAYVTSKLIIVLVISSITLW